MSEWKACKLGEVATFSYGTMPKKEKLGKGQYPTFSGYKYQDQYPEYNCEKGDLIVVARGVGGTGDVKIIKEKCYLTNLSIKINLDKSKLDNQFFYYNYAIETLRYLDSGSAQSQITINDLSKILILIPNLSEQKAIAGVLSSLDDKIDLLHRQNKTLEAMAETLFKQWFIIEARADWETKPLGDVIETTSGGTPSRNKIEYYESGIINWVKSKELSGSFILDTEEKITEDALKNSSAKLLPKNSILIAMYGATVGEYAIISKEMTCNQAICALKPNNEYPYTFLFLFIKNNKEDLINMAVGSAQQNISQLLIKQLPIPTCYKQIKKFDAIIKPCFKKIEINQKQIQVLEKLRDELLPKLMSGEIRVKLTNEK